MKHETEIKEPNVEVSRELTLNIPVSKEEKNDIRVAASKRGLTMASYVRLVTLAEARK